MQSQFARLSGHDQAPEASVIVHHPEDEGHHEKKPTKVLKKVKEKAKKVKHTLTKHGHDHDHDRGEHVPDDHDLDEEDDEDEGEEMIKDPKVHGAPMYESAAVRGGVTGQPETLSHPGKSHVPTPEEVVPPGTKVFPIVPSGSARPFEPVGGSGRDNIPAHPIRDSNVFDREKNKEALKTPEKSPVSGTFVSGEEESRGQRKVNLDRPTGLEEDPTAPKEGPDVSSYFSNYQTKVTDPTREGGEIAETDPMIQSFLKMKVTGDKSDMNTGPGLDKELPRKDNEPFSHLSMGSHDQFSLERSPPKPLENSPSETEALDTRDQPKQGSYTEKIASATSAVAEKAATVVSKLGYSGGHGSRGEEETPKSAVEDGKKVSSMVTEKLTPVYEKVKETGTSLMTKMPLYDPTNKGQDRGVSSVRNYLAEKLRPGEEDRALSEVITERLRPTEKEKRRGRVTESEEVAKRLGGFDDRRAEEEKEKYGESAVADEKNGGVVEKLKGAFGSWLSGTTEEVTQESSRSLQDSALSLGSTIGTVGSARGDVGEAGGGGGQRRLQNSGN